MKDIEDQFQALADRIVDGLSCVCPEHTVVATRFFALWSLRTQARHTRASDPALNGVGGEELTKDQQEMLEKSGGGYIRPDQTMPARFLTGLGLQRGVDEFCSFFGQGRWGVVRANEGEFICPDSFGQLIAILVTPAICLYFDHSDCVIPRSEVARANRLAEHFAIKYYLARDFNACPC